ncbi:hypothetical protein FB562_0881 [Homoserinimonas aerilata]|uniref:Uncharacterized protein n=2 Tax=Homoserinimonas aerilata TaxID=1162970 RepID=A0A542YI91_9MICO|nr:hypothetical protein FB562_0881 [Homoserinimonas aerilata]
MLAWQVNPEAFTLVVTLATAVVVLAVIAVDLRRLRVASGLTVAHGVVGASFALVVLLLTLMMASSLVSIAANADESERGQVAEAPEFPADLQLPTLPLE